MSALPLLAHGHRSETWARSQFSAAEHLHTDLEARPPQELARPDYQRVINAYRRVYFEAPNSSKADPSVVAVAELLEEMGRHFDDEAILDSAVREYEFLRQQYPGSKARFRALFRIGEIYREDLHDKKRSDEVFREFLRRYPRNQFAEQARQALQESAETSSAAFDVTAKTVGPGKPGRAISPQNATEMPQISGRNSEEESGGAAASGGSMLGRVIAIRHWSTTDSSHIAIDLQREVKYESRRLSHPDRIFFDLHNTKLDTTLKGKVLELDQGLVKKIRISQFNTHETRVVLEVERTVDFEASILASPPRLEIAVRSAPATAKVIPQSDIVSQDGGRLPGPVSRALPDVGTESNLDQASPKQVKAETQIKQPSPSSDDKTARNLTFIASDGVKKTIVDAETDDTPQPAAKPDAPDSKPMNPSTTEPGRVGVVGSKTKRKSATERADAREAQPTAAGDRSLIRALGLKIGKIVIDPGHGGHDTGTIGPHGLEEKELVLDVSQRLGKLLSSRLGAEVVYTRSDDTFIPLETRTAIANQEAADLFVSIHANSSRDPDARGVETYYLNFSSSPDALEVAARENAVSEESIHELQDLVKKIALKEKIEESREFAVDVEHSLHGGLAAKNSGVRDRGVKKAPFIVLIGANMPSILAEISFLSNPADERRLKTNDYRQRIAESLYRGIAKYVNGLSGVRVASKIEKADRQ